MRIDAWRSGPDGEAKRLDGPLQLLALERTLKPRGGLELRMLAEDGSTGWTAVHPAAPSHAGAVASGRIGEPIWRLLNTARNDVIQCRRWDAVPALEQMAALVDFLPAPSWAVATGELAAVVQAAGCPEPARAAVDAVRSRAGLDPLLLVDADLVAARLVAAEGDLTAAVGELDRALGRLADVSGSHQAARARLERARLGAERGETESAFQDLAAALEALEADGGTDPLLRAEVLAERGRLEVSAGEYEAAERTLLEARRLAEETAPGSLTTARTLVALAVLDHQQGNPRELAVLDQARDLVAELGPCTAVAAEVHRSLARLSLAREFPAQAAEHLERAVAVLEQLPGRQAEAIDVQLQRGRLAIDEADYGRAVEILDQAADDQRRIAAEHPLLPEILRDRAVAALLAGDYPTAEKDLGEALRVVRRTAPVTWPHAAILSTFGELRRRQGRLDEAESALRAMAGLLDELEAAVADPRSRTRLAFAHQGHRTALYRLLLERGEVAGALRVLEDSRLRVGRLWRSEEEETEPSQQQKQPAPTDLETLWEALDEGLLVLSFSIGSAAVPRSMWGDQKSHVIAVGPGRGEIAVAEIPTTGGHFSPFGRAVEALRRGIVESRHQTRAEAIARARAAELTDLLLSPVADAVRRARTILFVGVDGLPASALLDPHSLDGEPHWLIETKSLFFAPSASAWVQRRERRRPDLLAGGPIAVFADPAMDGRMIRVAGDDRHLAPLPASRREAEAIREAFGARVDVLLGERATEARLRSLPQPAAILHLGTHSFFDDESWTRSSLVLAEGDVEDRRDDGTLTATEILDELSLDCELVVLSSCRSGASFGPFSLPFALQSAGARTVLSSLWPVADDATAELMSRFYRHVAAGEPFADALSTAQSELASGEAADGAFRSPYYWAGFFLHGDGR